jgi:hypothetical protein
MATTPAIAPVLFNPANLTLFFEGADAMALSNCTHLRLAIERIFVPNNFNNFDDNGLDAIFTNLVKPPKVAAIWLADCNAGLLLEIMAFEVSAKSKMRLKGAMKIAKFYENIDRPLDPDNMTWVVIKHFLEQWKALMERKKEDIGLPPKLTKSSPVHKWLELISLYLGKKVGVCNAPLSYVVHLDSNVPAIAPPCQAEEPHSKMYKLIERDLTARLSHTHALFKVDNGTVFDLVKSSTRGSNVAPTIAPFLKTQNGRGVMLALKSQHAGKAIWDCLVKEAKHTLSNKVWFGKIPMTLAQHMGMHRHAWITLTECAKHISVDVPNDCA